MTPIQKLAKLALDNPELKPDLMPIIRRYASAKQVTGPPTTEIYPKKIDHGYNEPLAGGTDVMKRLQDQLLIEQGSEPREPNPRLAFCQTVQSRVAALARESDGARDAVRVALRDYMEATGETVVVATAVEAILDEAVAVALDPQRIGRIVAHHTAKE